MPFLSWDKISEDELVTLEAIYGFGVHNCTLKAVDGSPIKGVVVPDYEGYASQHIESRWAQIELFMFEKARRAYGAQERRNCFRDAY